MDRQKLIIILVGLPGRGKTFLCNKLMCYLNWCAAGLRGNPFPALFCATCISAAHHLLRKACMRQGIRSKFPA